MYIEAISEVVTQVTGLTGAIQAEGMGNVCAKAPQGVQTYANDIVGWIKWGVIVLIIGAGFASVGMMVAGKISSSGRAAQTGASGMFWTMIGAIAFVTIYAILNGIVGNGC